jgi:hypothetical protein
VVTVTGNTKIKNHQPERTMQNEYELEHELEQELEGESEFEAEGETEFEGESEFEGELESEYEGESESEAEGELELEYEGEGESEFEGEGESEQFLGGLLRTAGGMLGLGESELEQEFLGEMGEFEGEQFFKKLRGLGRVVKGFVKKAAPVLKQVGRIAAPLVGKALGGVIGGPAGAMLGSKLGNFAASQLREGEFEFEHEFEHEQEFEFEQEQEFEHELESHEQMGELMAHFAAQAESEAEAEAMIGASTMVSLSPRDRRALRGLVPQLVRGASILTRALRMRRRTRPAVRLVPTIMRRTAKTLTRAAASGRPVSPKTAAKVAARQVRSVLSKPSTCSRTLRRSITAARRAAGRR